MDSTMPVRLFPFLSDISGLIKNIMDHGLLRAILTFASPTDTSLWTNETRTLYFDNISWYNVDEGQTDGYDVVAP
jgi:hypothetical protein